MNKNRHLTLEERIIIESWLQKKESFKSIGRELCKDPTTIAKEVKNHIQSKVDKKYRLGRTYQDFLDFMQRHPGTLVVEMDSVEGKTGGKVLLTQHFTVPQFMIAFIRDANTSQSVIDIFNQLWQVLEPDSFRNHLRGGIYSCKWLVKFHLWFNVPKFNRFLPLIDHILPLKRAKVIKNRLNKPF